jgi:hypothetical protein
MATFNKFNSFVEALAEKTHNLGSDVLKVMLTNSAPSSANTIKTDITDIAAGNGYTAGGTQATIVHVCADSGNIQTRFERHDVYRVRWVDRAFSICRFVQRHGIKR